MVASCNVLDNRTKGLGGNPLSLVRRLSILGIMAQAFGVMSARRSRHWVLRKRRSHMVRCSMTPSYLAHSDFKGNASKDKEQ